MYGLHGYNFSVKILLAEFIMYLVGACKQTTECNFFMFLWAIYLFTSNIFF